MKLQSRQESSNYQGKQRVPNNADALGKRAVVFLVSSMPPLIEEKFVSVS
jgi:hypothetical protein